MPDDEGKTQDDENNDFPVWPFSIGVPPTMEMTTTRMGWNMFAFLRKELLVSLDMATCRKEKIQEDILHKIHFEKSPALMFQKYSIL